MIHHSLLNILGTIDKPTSGQVYLFGKEVKFNENDDNLAKLRLQHVFLFLIEFIVDWICIPDI